LARKLAFAFSFIGSMVLATQVHAREDAFASQIGPASQKQKETRDLVIPSNRNGFTAKKMIGEYLVSFQVIPRIRGVTRKQQGDTPENANIRQGKDEKIWEIMANPSHSLMVKVERNGQVVTNIIINSRVIHPDKSSESKIMARTGDWYEAGYYLERDGRYKIIILFKTESGAKHSGVIYYSSNPKEKS